jgi:hypothetical protein
MIINRIYENQNLLSLWLVSFLVGLRTYQHPCKRNIFARLTSCNIIGWPRNHRTSYLTHPTCNPLSGTPPECDSTPRVLSTLSLSHRNRITRCILIVIALIVRTSEISVWSEWCPPIYQHTAPSPPNLTKRDHHKALARTNNRKFIYNALFTFCILLSIIRDHITYGTAGVLNG